MALAKWKKEREEAFQLCNAMLHHSLPRWRNEDDDGNSGYNDNDNCFYDADDDVESIVDGNDDDDDIERTTKTSSSP